MAAVAVNHILRPGSVTSFRCIAGTLIALAACGRLADDGDAGDASPTVTDASMTVDAPFRCDPSLPFDFNAAVPLTELNTGYSQGGLSLTPDELTAVFVRWGGLDGGDSQGMAVYELFITTRPSISAPFAPPTMVPLQLPPLTLPNQALSFYEPSITADALAVFAPCVIDWTAAMCVVARETTAETFGVVLTMQGPCACSGVTTALDCDCNAFVTNDGLRAYAQPYYYPYPSSTGVFLAQHDTHNSSFAYGQVVLAFPADLIVTNPVITSDELTLFVHTQTQYSTNIATATRTTTSEPFGALTNIETIDLDTAEDMPTWASPDGCRLYFERDVWQGGPERGNIFVASRAN